MKSLNGFTAQSSGRVKMKNEGHVKAFSKTVKC